jgi:hypothetical protein
VKSYGEQLTYKGWLSLTDVGLIHTDDDLAAICFQFMNEGDALWSHLIPHAKVERVPMRICRGNTFAVLPYRAMKQYLTQAHSIPDEEVRAIFKNIFALPSYPSRFELFSNPPPAYRSSFFI